MQTNCFARCPPFCFALCVLSDSELKKLILMADLVIIQTKILNGQQVIWLRMKMEKKKSGPANI